MNPPETAVAPAPITIHSYLHAAATSARSPTTSSTG